MQLDLLRPAVGLIARLPSLVVLALVSGCSFWGNNGLSDWNPFSDPFSVRSEPATAGTADAPFPNLAGVPDRPTVTARGVRARVTEGLMSDRNNARYTAEAIRLQGQTERTVPRPRNAGFESIAAGPRLALTSQFVETDVPSTIAATNGNGTNESMLGMTPVAVRAIRLQEQTERTALRPESANLTSLKPAVLQVAVDEPLMAVINTNSTSEMFLEMKPVAMHAIRLQERTKRTRPTSNELPPQLQLATIYFPHNSSQLNHLDIQILNQVAAAQNRYGGSLRVVGHASGGAGQPGSGHYNAVNQKISLIRANSVAEALNRLGVATTELTVEARGDRQPLYAETMPTGEAGNRRAEVYLIR